MLTADVIERISLHGFKSFSVEVEACESKFQKITTLSNSHPNFIIILEFLKSTISRNTTLQQIPGSSSVFKKLNEVCFF